MGMPQCRIRTSWSGSWIPLTRRGPHRSLRRSTLSGRRWRPLNLHQYSRQLLSKVAPPSLPRHKQHSQLQPLVPALRSLSVVARLGEVRRSARMDAPASHKGTITASASLLQAHGIAGWRRSLLGRRPQWTCQGVPRGSVPARLWPPQWQSWRSWWPAWPSLQRF